MSDGLWNAILEIAKTHPFLGVFAIVVCVAIANGPAYIKEVSEALSRKRRDDAELSEQERRYEKRLEDKRGKR